MRTNGEALDERRQPFPAHPANSDAGCERGFKADHARSGVVVRQQLLGGPVWRVVGGHSFDDSFAQRLDERIAVASARSGGIDLAQRLRNWFLRHRQPHREVMRRDLRAHGEALVTRAPE